jgi:hypothetical protein
MSKRPIEVLGSTSLRYAAGGTAAVIARNVYWPGGPGKLTIWGTLNGAGTVTVDSVSDPNGAYLYAELVPGINATIAAAFPPGLGGALTLDFVAPEGIIAFTVGGLAAAPDSVSLGSVKLIPVSH